MILKNKTSLFLWALFFSLPSVAQKNDHSQPIQIEANSASHNESNGQTEFSGNVLISQGSLHIKAAKVRIIQQDNKQQQITASGSPVTFSQNLDEKKDGKTQTIKGRARTIIYNSDSAVAVLTGNAKVQRGGDVVQGHRIHYNTKTETYSVTGGSSGSKKGRVSVILQPESFNKKEN